MSDTAPRVPHGTLTRLASHPVVQLVTARFQSANVELHLVGGCVRDALMGNESFDDLDFATPADVDVIARLLAPLGAVFDVGARFGTVSCAVRTADGSDKVEITQFRTEAYSEDSRKPTVVAARTLREDLIRRDLTINAVALRVSPAPVQLIDPFGGADDLAAGLLRTPGDADGTFAEDPLRIIRVVRFAARFGFTVDADTEAAARRRADRLSIVAAERVTAELRKIVALGPKRAASAIRHADRLGVAEHLFGGLPCDAETAASVERLDDGRLALAVLAHSAGADAFKALDKLKLSHDELNPVKRTAALVDLLQGQDIAGVRSALRANGTLVDDALQVAMARNIDVNAAAQLVEAARTLHPDIAERQLPVNGNDAVAAGLKGPAVGAALRTVEAAFLRDPDLTRSRALELLAS